MANKSDYKFKHICPKCKKKYPQDQLVYQCPCGSKVIIEFNMNEMELSPKDIKARYDSSLPLIEKYFELLPLLKKDNLVHLGEGDTPLVHARNMGNKLGLPNLYLKNEINNPTGSFKDRPINVGLNRALEFNAEYVASASSGNAANSLAAGSSKANITCIAFVPSTAANSKINQLLLYGAEVFPVEKPTGYIGDPTVAMLTNSYKELGFHPIPSFGHLNPYQMEGAKTMGYEIALEIEPDHIVVPVGGGGLYMGNHRAFMEFKELGIVDNIPSMHVVQGEGCSPLVKAFNEEREISTCEDPHTIANGLADPFTWDGERVIEALKINGGSAVGIKDNPIIKAQKILARYEGIFAEPTGSAALAGMLELVHRGKIDKKDDIVVEVTGHGFKDLGVIDEYFSRPEPVLPELSIIKNRLGLR